MTINPALNAAILTAINTLQTATLIPNPTIKEHLVGALMQVNATVGAHSRGQVRKELEHIIAETSVVSGPYVRKGYTQAALEALS